MTPEDSLQAYTLGELGLLLAVVLLFLLGGSIASREASDSPPEREPRTLEIDSLKAALARSEARVESLLAALDSVRHNRSPLRPSCAQRGIVDGYLFDAVIVGGNAFAVGADTLSLDNIRSRFQRSLREAESVGCVHQVQARMGTGVDYDEFVRGWDRLRRMFYLRLR